MARKLSVFDKHQLKVARQVLKAPDAMVPFMGGGLTKDEARDIIEKLTGRRPKESFGPLQEAVKAEVRRQILAQKLHRPVQRRASERDWKDQQVSKALRAVQSMVGSLDQAGGSDWARAKKHVDDLGAAVSGPNWDRHSADVRRAYVTALQGVQGQDKAMARGGGVKLHAILKKIATERNQQAYDAKHGGESVRETERPYTKVRFKGGNKQADNLSAAKDLEQLARQAGHKAQRSGSTVKFQDGIDEGAMDELIDKVYSKFPEGEYPMANTSR